MIERARYYRATNLCYLWPLLACLDAFEAWRPVKADAARDPGVLPGAPGSALLIDAQAGGGGAIDCILPYGEASDPSIEFAPTVDTSLCSMALTAGRRHDHPGPLLKLRTPAV